MVHVWPICTVGFMQKQTQEHKHKSNGNISTSFNKKRKVITNVQKRDVNPLRQRKHLTLDNTKLNKIRNHGTQGTGGALKQAEGGETDRLTDRGETEKLFLYKHSRFGAENQKEGNLKECGDLKENTSVNKTKLEVKDNEHSEKQKTA